MPLLRCPRCGPPHAGDAHRLLRRRRRSDLRPPPQATTAKCHTPPPPPPPPPPPVVSRRAASAAASLLLAALPLPASPPQSSIASELKASGGGGGGGGEMELELEPYTNQAEGFTLLKPSSWPKVEKAGATVLFQQEGKGSNNIGVVVNPVRLSSLTEFGTPQFVTDRLLQAEKKKESTKAAEVISVRERSGHGGLTVYEIEYSLDSTRGGLKRIFSAAFVASRKLYLLNIAYSDSQEKPLDSQTRMVLEQVLHSFDSV